MKQNEILRTFVSVIYRYPIQSFKWELMCWRICWSSLLTKWLASSKSFTIQSQKNWTKLLLILLFWLKTLRSFLPKNLTVATFLNKIFDKSYLLHTMQLEDIKSKTFILKSTLPSHNITFILSIFNFIRIILIRHQ